MTKLRPPDLRQCQAEIRSPYTPFVMGGSVGGTWARCTRPPKWIVEETVAGEDGLKGSMSLCDECKLVCEKKAINPVKFTQIKELSVGRR